MNYTHLLVSNDTGIVTLTINRPEALNAINKKVMQDLNAFFSDGYKEAGKFHGIIITGAGEKAFVAGADIKEFSGFSADQGEELSLYGHNTYFLIERFHVPVIAVVKGYALGGGCELAMACHMRIAGPKARFGQPEVNLGLIPGYAGTQRLIQLIGKSKALELLLTADMVGAEEAKVLGLVNHVTESGDEMSKAREILDKCGSKGPIAIEKTIALVNEHFESQLPAFRSESRAFGETIATEDCREGSAAFIEKRKPEFKGK